ncbi:MAG: SPOR domain-containing protein [Fibrobacter sp.]|nr:SPOR domain-containing protein [Fibrobacter sp.]
MRLFLLSFLILSFNVWGQNPCDEKTTQATLLEAQKLYISQQWAEATEKFVEAIPCLPGMQKLEPKLWSIRSLAQDSATIEEALSQLDTLIVSIEPEQKEYLNVMLTSVGALLQADKNMEAWKSWRQAKQVSLGRDHTQLHALCLQLAERIDDPKIKKECKSLKSLKLQTQIAKSTITSPLTPPIIKTAKNQNGEGNWVLQFGAFGVKNNAELLMENLKQQNIPCRIVTKNAANRVLWLVQTQAFANKEDALQYGTTTLLPLQLDFQAIPAQ